MEQILVELPECALDRFMLEDLTRHYGYALKDSPVPMYSHDYVIERKKRKKLAKALKKVIQYYGGDVNAKNV